MKNIPRQLYSKNIVSYINELSTFNKVKDFDSLDDIYQDQLVSLGMQALGNDVEIILGYEANCLLAKYLISNDRDDEIELTRRLKESAREKFSYYFNELINELSWKKSA